MSHLSRTCLNCDETGQTPPGAGGREGISGLVNITTIIGGTCCSTTAIVRSDVTGPLFAWLDGLSSVICEQCARPIAVGVAEQIGDVLLLVFDRSPVDIPGALFGHVQSPADRGPGMSFLPSLTHCPHKPIGCWRGWPTHQEAMVMQS